MGKFSNDVSRRPTKRNKEAVSDSVSLSAFEGFLKGMQKLPKGIGAVFAAILAGSVLYHSTKLEQDKEALQSSLRSAQERAEQLAADMDKLKKEIDEKAAPTLSRGGVRDAEIRGEKVNYCIAGKFPLPNTEPSPLSYELCALTGPLQKGVFLLTVVVSDQNVFYPKFIDRRFVCDTNSERRDGFYDCYLYDESNPHKFDRSKPLTSKDLLKLFDFNQKI